MSDRAHRGDPYVRIPSRPILAAIATLFLAGCAGGSSLGGPPPTAGDEFAQSIAALKHNAWAKKAPMPTARYAAAAAAIGTKIYVLGGINVAATGTPLGTNEIYDTVHNKWSTGAAMPTPRWAFGVAAVQGKLYAIGGQATGNVQTNVVEEYDPVHDSWTTKTPMPTSRDSLSVAPVGTFAYAIGGYGGGSRLATVERYDTVHDKWVMRTSLLVAKSGANVGAVGTAILAAGGLASSGVTADTESYSTAGNAWTGLHAETNLRQSSCAGAIAKNLYAAGGSDTSGNPLGSLDIFDSSTNLWSAGAAMLQAAIKPAAAIVRGRLYCFGGANQGYPTSSTVFYNNVQVYTP
jgi:hypothetical protein